MIDRHHTALLVMDFQHDIVDPGGLFGSQGTAQQIRQRDVVGHTMRALAAARRASLLVVHVAVAYRPGHPEISGDAPPLFKAIKDGNALVEGTLGASFHPDLAPVPGELVVVKRLVSALAGTDLDAILRARGIHALVLCGIATNFVVEGTTRDAVDRGYAVTVLADCCATFSEDMHRAALAELHWLGRISSADEFARELDAA